MLVHRLELASPLLNLCVRLSSVCVVVFGYPAILQRTHLICENKCCRRHPESDAVWDLDFADLDLRAELDFLWWAVAAASLHGAGDGGVSVLLSWWLCFVVNVFGEVGVGEPR